MTYGFEHGQLAEEIELFFEYPSKVAAMLLNGQADIGLIPVAVIPTLAEAHIISDYCIGTDGEVASVCLFSDVPVNEIKQVYLDYQSRTSVALLKILLKKHWNIQPELLEATPGFEEKIGGATAGLVIGDRAFLQRNRSAYIYDLGTAWRELTGLPFVFAAWVANKEQPPAFINAFNKATGEGMNHIEEIVAQNPYPAYSMDTYYRVNINYRLDEEKRKALKLFLEWL